VQISHFLNSDATNWSAAYCKLLPSCGAQWKAVAHFERTLEQNSFQVRENKNESLRQLTLRGVAPPVSAESPRQLTLRGQWTACLLLSHHPLAWTALLLKHVQLTAHNLLDVQLEMLPPSLHAIICAAQLSKLPCGGNQLVLDVSSAAVLEAAAAALTRVQSLDSLVLTACRTTSQLCVTQLYHTSSQPSFSFLGCLTSLKKLQLNLRNCAFTPDLGCLTSVTALQFLDLSNSCFVTDIGLQQISGLTGLQHLKLAGCPQITDQGLQYLINLTALQYLDISSCLTLTDLCLEPQEPYCLAIPRLTRVPKHATPGPEAPQRPDLPKTP
jgi:hypothetical protein